MIEQEIITGNRFKNICDDYLDEDKTYIDISKKPKSIFLKTDWIECFKQKVLPQINYTFKLITHNADRSAPSGNLDLLEDSRLIKWFAMNCDIQHPKLQTIPIGIANEKWPHGNKQELLDVINTEIPKTELCYSNFDLKTNFKRRSEIFEIIKNKKFINIEEHSQPFKSYLKKLKSYKYVISPPGNSIDCHRIWEAIYIGVIPIVEKHIAMDYFQDLPILFVDNFNDITSDILTDLYPTIKIKYINKAQFTNYKKIIKNYD